MSTETKTREDTEEDLEAWLNGLIKRSNQGEKDALVQIRKLLAETACQGILMEQLGNVARIAESCYVRLMGGPANQASIKAKLEALRAELTGADSCPLERLLVDRVVACWLQAAYADMKATEQAETFQQADFHQRQQDRAHRRLLTAVKTLATVRRLALPIKVDVSLETTVTTKSAQANAPARPRCCPPIEAADARHSPPGRQIRPGGTAEATTDGLVRQLAQQPDMAGCDPR